MRATVCPTCGTILPTESLSAERHRKRCARASVPERRFWLRTGRWPWRTLVLPAWCSEGLGGEARR